MTDPECTAAPAPSERSQETDFFIWRDDWLLNIELLDCQHKAIAACLNTLARHYRAGQESGNTAAWEQEQTDLLARLRNMTGQHFRDEEQLMHDIQYTDRQRHRNEHVVLLAELKRCISDITTGKEELDTQVLNHLKTWLISHIIDSDRKLAKHYLSCQHERQTNYSSNRYLSH